MKQLIQIAFGTFALLVSGVIYAWSILATPIMKEYSMWSLSQISLTFTFCTLSFCIGGFFRGVFSEKYSASTILVISAILCSTGLWLSAEIQSSIICLYIGFGVLCGISIGMAYNTIMSTIVQNTSKNKGVVSGVLLMGFGLGSFVTGKIYQVILSTGLLDWRGIFQLLAGVFFVLYIIVAIVFKGTKNTHVSNTNTKTATEQGISTAEMLTTTTFWIYFIWAVLLASCGYALLAHASGILYEANPYINTDTAATLVGVISICNGLGRMLWGIIYDKLQYKKTMLLIELVFAFNIFSLLNGLRLGETGHIIFGFICGGLFFAGLAALNSLCINDFFGSKHYPLNFSIINLNVLLSSFGSTIAAIIYDKMGTYMYIMIVFVCAWLLSMICIICLKKKTIY